MLEKRRLENVDMEGAVIQAVGEAVKRLAGGPRRIRCWQCIQRHMAERAL